MFKVGDKVRCIDNDNNDIKVNLTVGKIYEVVDDVNNPSPTVINDENKKVDYFPERFELVTENKTKEIESDLNLKFIPMDSVQIITLDGVKGFLMKA